MKYSPTDYLSVPVRMELIQEIYRRSDLRKKVPIATYVESALEGFLDRTEGDGEIWENKEYVETCWEENDLDEKFKHVYGNSNQGYQWKTLFLPNGSKLRMNYNGIDHHAEVKHEKIIYEGEEYSSPSQLASKIANNTNRNAWRDFFVLRSANGEWELADTARRDPSPRRSFMKVG